jgi:hypothetical protein
MSERRDGHQTALRYIRQAEQSSDNRTHQEKR